jgi:hypothetical protein
MMGVMLASVIQNELMAGAAKPVSTLPAVSALAVDCAATVSVVIAQSAGVISLPDIGGLFPAHQHAYVELSPPTLG